MLRAHLFRGTGNEEAAFLIAGTAEQNEATDLLVQEVVPVPVEGLLSQGPTHLEIDPDFMMPIIKRCRTEGASLIDVHSHPGGGRVSFSHIDDSGDSELLPKVKQRVPNRHHASLVFNRDSVNARIWRYDREKLEHVDRIVVVGQPLETIELRVSAKQESEDITAYDRQVLMFGTEGQRLLQNTTIAVVGCGGTGSLVVQHLSRLGVGRLLLFDHDRIECSNFSRIVGATEEDVLFTRPKVEIAYRQTRQANPKGQVEAIQGTVLDQDIALRLLEADVIVCCTDTVASRMVLNRIAFQYLRPLMDCGIDIKVTSSGQAKVIGRVMTVLPDGPCLSCAGIINPDAVADELADPIVRAGYIDQANVHAPSVITLNGVVSSLAATEVLDLVVGFKEHGCSGSQIAYYGHKGIVESEPMGLCVPCSVCRDVRSAGDKLMLPCSVSL